MSWLKQLKKMEDSPETNPTKPTKGPFAGFVGSQQGTFPKLEEESDALPAPVLRFMERGLSLAQAEPLAIKLAQRDQTDGRRLCIECAYLSKSAEVWRCGQWQQRQHYSPDIPSDLVTVTLHRCKAFSG